MIFETRGSPVRRNFFNKVGGYGLLNIVCAPKPTSSLHYKCFLARLEVKRSGDSLQPLRIFQINTLSN